MKWLVLLLGLLMAACTGPTLVKGQHIQAHGKLFLQVKDIQIMANGMVVQFVDGRTPVVCGPAACIIGSSR